MSGSPRSVPVRVPGPGQRFRCDGCGNVTRFDVIERTRTRRFLHVDLGGFAVIEEEEVLDHRLESVMCHWCGTGTAVRTEPAPSAAAPGGAVQGGAEPGTAEPGAGEPGAAASGAAEPGAAASDAAEPESGPA